MTNPIERIIVASKTAAGKVVAACVEIRQRLRRMKRTESVDFNAKTVARIACAPWRGSWTVNRSRR
jgi:hypothetical protein